MAFRPFCNSSKSEDSVWCYRCQTDRKTTHYRLGYSSYLQFKVLAELNIVYDVDMTHSQMLGKFEYTLPAKF